MPTPSPVEPLRPPVLPKVIGVKRIGYSIQVGAFAKPENAARLAEALCERGLDATYFQGSKDLFRVRFGDFASKEEALARAVALVEDGSIAVFYIVSPQEVTFPASKTGPSDLRGQLVETALAQLGVPYLWGGSTRNGFDCSGLVLTVYRLNGYGLPRSSWAQFEEGEPVDKASLQAGDLVFFATHKPGRVSHVGIYIGQGEFVHAPRRGKIVQREQLSSRYFSRRYLGARRYFG